MAKKTRQNPPRPKEFHSAPFQFLKGLPLTTAVAAPPEPPIVNKAAEPADDGRLLFLQAVADVKPINLQPAEKAFKDAAAILKTKAGSEKIPAVEERVSALFLEEIGRLRLDTKFEDSLPDDGEIQPLSGNRLRQVRRGIVSVGHQLDLHGLNREEALAALPVFLRSAIQRGQKAVLVITGKGIRSPAEPVLQQAVASWLRDAGRELVLEYAPAPREMGGNGAFVIFLRHKFEKKIKPPAE